MLFDDLVFELRDQHVRGPVIDEVMTYLQLQDLVTYQTTTSGTWVHAS